LIEEAAIDFDGRGRQARLKKKSLEEKKAI
jgi:hypothetical protein